MRVGDRGSSFPHQQGSGRDRAQAFRRDRRIGERVRGRYLREAEPGMVWVDIEGHELKAQATGAISPDEIITFEIVELAPEVVLRRLTRDDGRLNRRV